MVERFGIAADKTMKIVQVKKYKSASPVCVLDMGVADGYRQGEGGSLPDVDVDFQSDRRQEVKEYLEKRYNKNGKQRVFSAGTVTKMKARSVMKDVARVMHVPVGVVNYMSAIIQDDSTDYTGLFKLGYEVPKFGKFINSHPDLFEAIRVLMGQPRSSSIHASALLVTPDERDGESVECFDFVPVKKMGDILVSDNDGYELDELGLLKNDVLATKELSKLQQVMELCNREYGSGITLESLTMDDCDDPRVYALLQRGFTQNVFQFSSKGITKFLMDMKPECIGDLIAANAIYRPATMENGAMRAYLDCRTGFSEPVYKWGTYDALKETYGNAIYQEQIVLISRKVGGFSLGDGVKLVKYISKKKTEKIKLFKDKFLTGAEKNGCPKEDADAIWEQIEACGSYLFNKSHATAYAITAYAGAWLKAVYPTAFYTVALEWADDKELVPIMGEMEQLNVAKLVLPDVNMSDEIFHTDYSQNLIYWSLTRIKMLGYNAAKWIIDEREKHGYYKSIEDFIDRVFKYKFKHYSYFDDPDNMEEVKRCPVNARHVKNMIMAGCFDKVENIQSIAERYDIILRAASALGFVLKDKDFPEDMVGKHYFWSSKQIEVSGMGAIDYRRIYDESEAKKEIGSRASYHSLKEILDDSMDGRISGICATVTDMEVRQFTSKRTGEVETFMKITLQQNSDTSLCVVWNSEYKVFEETLSKAKNRIIAFSGSVKYSDYDSRNEISFYRNTKIQII